MIRKRKLVVTTGAALAAAQLLSADHGGNGSAESTLAAPSDIEQMLRGACFACHSRETRRPWYRTVAPLSWLIARDVSRGRRELDLSQWRSYYPATRRRKL